MVVKWVVSYRYRTTKQHTSLRPVTQLTLHPYSHHYLQDPQSKYLRRLMLTPQLAHVVRACADSPALIRWQKGHFCWLLWPIQTGIRRGAVARNQCTPARRVVWSEKNDDRRMVSPDKDRWASQPLTLQFSNSNIYLIRLQWDLYQALRVTLSAARMRFPWELWGCINYP